jgi:hypothetical protein
VTYAVEAPRSYPGGIKTWGLEELEETLNRRAKDGWQFAGYVPSVAAAWAFHAAGSGGEGAPMDSSSLHSTSQDEYPIYLVFASS